MKDEKIYIVESGVKRSAEMVNCENCSSQFIRRKNSSRPKKFCSRECFNKSKLETLKCANCGSEIIRPKSKLKRSKSGLYFCNRQCKEYAQSFKGNCKEIQPDHYIDETVCYRRIITEQETPCCVDCNETRLWALMVHHKDGNRKNNVKQNLEIVCATCHMKRHLYKNKDGNWVHSYKKLTPREVLSSL